MHALHAIDEKLNALPPQRGSCGLFRCHIVKIGQGRHGPRFGKLSKLLVCYFFNIREYLFHDRFVAFFAG